MAHVGKPFTEQFVGYLRELASLKPAIRTVWDLNTALDISLTRDEFEGMIGGTPPPQGFAETFANMLFRRQLVDDAAYRDFIRAASQIKSPEVGSSIFTIEAERRMARHDTVIEVAPRSEDPERAERFKDVLEEFYWANKSLQELVEYVLQHPRMNNDKFARFRSSMLQDAGEGDDLSGNMVDRWAQQPATRTPATSIRILRRAYGAGELEAGMMREMSRRDVAVNPPAAPVATAPVAAAPATILPVAAAAPAPVENTEASAPIENTLAAHRELFRSKLNEHIARDGVWGEFIQDIVQSLHMNYEEFAQYLRTHSAAQEDQASWNLAVSWIKLGTYPHVHSMDILLKAFGAEDEGTQLALWKLCGEKIDMDAVLAQAVATGETGELARALIQSSGIRNDRLDELAGFSKDTLRFTVYGHKIADPERARRFIELTYRAELMPHKNPDEVAVQQQIMRDLFALKEQKKTTTLKLEKSFSEMVDESFAQKHSWRQLIENVLHQYNANVPEFLTYMKSVASAKGVPKEYVPTDRTLHQWLAGGKPQPKVLEQLCAVFDMPPLQERKMAKLASGRFLETGELVKWIEQAEAAMPKAAECKRALGALKTAGPDSLVDASAVAQAERDLFAAQKEVWGTLISQLRETSGMGEKRTATLVDSQKMEDWRAGKRPPALVKEAKTFIEVTLEAEIAAANPDISQPNLDRLYRVISQRPMTVEQVLAENDTSQWNTGTLLNALTGDRGIVTLNEAELMELFDISKQELKDSKKGYRVLDAEARIALMEKVECTNTETIKAVNDILDRRTERPKPDKKGVNER